MGIRPPAAEILGPEHPGFAVSAVGDRRPGLGVPCSIGGVEPVEVFTALDVRLQIGRIVNARPAARGIQVCCAVPPIRQGQIVVDADEVDVGIGPEWIEVEIEIAGAIAGLVAEVF